MKLLSALFVLILANHDSLTAQRGDEFACVDSVSIKNLLAKSSFSPIETDLLLYDTCSNTYAIFWLATTGEIHQTEKVGPEYFFECIGEEIHCDDQVRTFQTLLRFSINVETSCIRILPVLQPCTRLDQVDHLYEEVIGIVNKERPSGELSEFAICRLFELVSQIRCGVLIKEPRFILLYHRMLKDFKKETDSLPELGQFLRDMDCIFRSNHVIGI